MAEYLVVWKVEVEAANSVEAAEQARAIQRDPESTATVFEVSRRHRPPRVVTVTDTVDLSTPEG